LTERWTVGSFNSAFALWTFQKGENNTRTWPSVADFLGYAGKMENMETVKLDAWEFSKTRSEADNAVVIRSLAESKRVVFFDTVFMETWKTSFFICKPETRMPAFKHLVTRLVH
jgi:hypothetical protein